MAWKNRKYAKKGKIIGVEKTKMCFREDFWFGKEKNVLSRGRYLVWKRRKCADTGKIFGLEKTKCAVKRKIFGLEKKQFFNKGNIFGFEKFKMGSFLVWKDENLLLKGRYLV